MENLDEQVRIRAVVTKRSRNMKNDMEISWQRVMDLGLEQVAKVLKEVSDLEMIGAYTPAWISARGILRKNPTVRAMSDRMTPVLIYYILEVGRLQLRSTHTPRFFKLFYKERKGEKMRTKILNISKVRSCIMEEFRLNDEDAVQW